MKPREPLSVTLPKPLLQESLPKWCVDARAAWYEKIGTFHEHLFNAERYRYIDKRAAVKALSDIPLHEIKRTSFDQSQQDIEDAYVLHIVNGHLQQSAALPEGVIVCDIFTALKQHEALLKPVWPGIELLALSPFAGIALSLFNGGLFLYVPENVKLAKPIVFYHDIQSESLAQFHFTNFFVLGAHAKVQCFEKWCSDNTEKPHVVNVLNVLYAADHAVCQYTHLQTLSSSIWYWHAMQATLQNASRALISSFSLGAKHARYDYAANLQGAYAECYTNGFYHASSKNPLVDHHIEFLHEAPHTTSDMYFKGTITDKAKAIFNGRLVVAKDAQKINAYQANHHLLFSNEAESYSKPELEIYADDVKCKHGATTASLDPLAIFYLRSRGLSEPAAKRLLVDAFLLDATTRVPLSAAVERMVRQAILDVTHDL